MQKTIWIAMLCMGALNVQAWSEPKNFVKNGDFEMLTADNAPKDWKQFKPHYARVLESEDGNHYLRVGSHKLGMHRFVTQAVDLPENSSQVWISVRMRVTNLELNENNNASSARLHLVQFDAAGNRLEYGRSPRLNMDSDWQTITMWYPLEPGTASITVGCGLLDAIGTAEFDDVIISLKPVASKDKNNHQQD